MLDDRGEPLGSTELPTGSTEDSFSIFDAIKPLGDTERLDRFHQLVAVENELLRALLCLTDETLIAWLLETDDRLDSDGSKTLELEDLDGLGRRQRAEIAVRVSHAVVSEEIHFGEEIGRLSSTLLELRRTLFHDSLRFVAALAAQHANTLDASTAILRGALGLDTAIDRFEPERGHKFSTYAGWWIRHWILRSRANFSTAIRTPVHVAESCLHFWMKQQELWAQTGERPPASITLAEIERPMPPLERLAEYRRLSTVARLGGSASVDLAERILDVDIPTPMGGSSANRWVARAYSILLVQARRPHPRRDQQQQLALADTLTKRLAIGFPEPLTLQEIGETLGVSRERVRQHETAGLELLRERIFGKSGYLPPWRWAPPDE